MRGNSRDAARRACGARRPLIIAGGGVKYAGAEQALAQFAGAHGVPVAETQAGKGSSPGIIPATPARSG